MGILNVTPDSFSDGGRFSSPQEAVASGIRMVEAGADIIDVGGESTRPNADAVSPEEERARTEPVIRGIREHSDVPISIDTTKASVAEAALSVGADIINDISAMRFDPAIAEVAARSGAGVILMHTPGMPSEMDARAIYDDVVSDVVRHLHERVEAALAAGIYSDCIAVDPGYGFGKTPEQNYRLLAEVDRIVALGHPVLIGVSRKRHIRASVGAAPHAVEHGTTSANALALSKGVHMIRVHDVVAGVACVRLVASVSRSRVASESRTPPH
jgi:dihydropteroate synthase